MSFLDACMNLEEVLKFGNMFLMFLTTNDATGKGIYEKFKMH